MCAGISKIVSYSFVISLNVSKGFKYYKSITIDKQLYNVYVYRINKSIKQFNNKSIRIDRTITYKNSKHSKHRTHTKHSKHIYRHSKKNIKNGIETYSREFIISSKTKMNGLDYTTLRESLQKIGLHETSNHKCRPLFLWLEQLDNNTFDKQYYNTKCFIMNILSDEKHIIANKYQLYINFKKYYPIKCKQYMATSWNFITFINDVDNINDIENNVYIVRPVGVGAFSGKDIVIVNNNKTIQIAKKLIGRYENIIISKYVNNPMLYNERKFHLRTYFLVSIINGHYKTYFYEFYELFTAEKPYNNNDYTDKDVHDTHFKSTPIDILCPYDLEQVVRDTFNKHIYPKMKDCMIYISKLMEHNTHPYEQAENAFEIFGCDFLVKDNYDVILMEINDKTGFTMHRIEKKIDFSKQYLNVINELIIKPNLISSYNSKQKIHNNYNTLDDNTKLKWLYEN